MIDDIRDWLEDNADGVKALAVAAVAVTLLWWMLADSPVRVGPSPGPSGRVLIFLHGHGASKTDLEPLALQLSALAPRVSFVMPSGTHAVMRGRTWYPSFREDTQEAVRVRMFELRAEARAVATELADDAISDGVSPDQIYVGGFSQGATVALDVVLENERYGALVSLSGGSLKLDLRPLSQRPPLRAFVSHGKSDSVLNISKSRTIVAALEAGQHAVEFVDFDGRHEIPQDVIDALGAFLAAD